MVSKQATRMNHKSTRVREMPSPRRGIQRKAHLSPPQRSAWIRIPYMVGIVFEFRSTEQSPCQFLNNIQRERLRTNGPVLSCSETSGLVLGSEVLSLQVIGQRAPPGLIPTAAGRTRRGG